MSGQTLDKLIYMANQIAREFASQRPHDAVEATWDHLWHFWDPRMRGMIVAYLHEGGQGLSDVARAAVAKLTDDDYAGLHQVTQFQRRGSELVPVHPASPPGKSDGSALSWSGDRLRVGLSSNEIELVKERIQRLLARPDLAQLTQTR